MPDGGPDEGRNCRSLRSSKQRGPKWRAVILIFQRHELQVEFQEEFEARYCLKRSVLQQKKNIVKNHNFAEGSCGTRFELPLELVLNSFRTTFGTTFGTTCGAQFGPRSRTRVRASQIYWNSS